MHDVMDISGGKPILLDVPSTALAYSALLGAAAGAPVSITAADFEEAEVRARVSCPAKLELRNE